MHHRVTHLNPGRPAIDEDAPDLSFQDRQQLRGGGLYVNAGTWLPATRPGVRRSFTHVLIVPRAEGKPVVELRQWRDGSSVPFDAGANLGAGGMTDPHIDISELKRHL